MDLTPSDNRKDKLQPSDESQRLVERRSKKVNFAGDAMAVFIAVMFLGIYVLRAYQFDFWGHSFYSAANQITTGCEYAALSTKTKVFPAAEIAAITPRPISLPHGPDWFAAESDPRKILHVQYHCKIDQMDAANSVSGVPTLHFGWIMSDTAEITINGKKRLFFKGEENLSLALSDDEYVRGDLDLIVNASGTPRRRFGMAGLFPMAIGTDNTTNFKIRGLQMAIQQITPLYTLLPLLTLAIVLVFGWFMGLKSRLIVVTFFYFSLNLIFNAMVIFGEFTPWGLSKSYFLSRPFQISSWLAILLIGLELLQWRNRRIFEMSLAIVAALIVEVAIVASMKFPHGFIGPLWQTYRVIGMVGGIVLVVVAFRKAKETPKEHRKIFKWFIALMSFFSMLLCLDFLINVYNAPIKIGHYMELFLPLFISGLIFYTLSQIDKRLKAERERRASMESELNLAAKLQGILLPSEPNGIVGDVYYEIDSKPLGMLGGDWVKIHSIANRALFVLGDVVGKGASAALTHSAIASAWEAHIAPWSQAKISTEELLRNINDTMFKLFNGSMNSTFAAVEIIDGNVRVACGGNYWLHLDYKKPKPVGIQARALLGISAELEVRFQPVAIQEGDWLVTFTDGVLEGNRPLKKFVTSVTENSDRLDGKLIRELLSTAGSGSALPDDASSLILRYRKETVLKTA